MISELVAGSAWIWPPVDGCADAAIGAVAGLAPAAVALPVVGRGGDVPPPPAPPGVVAASAARSVTASLVASAFFR